MDILEEQVEYFHYRAGLEGLISHAMDIVQDMAVFGDEVLERFRRQIEIILKE